MNKQTMNIWVKNKKILCLILIAAIAFNFLFSPLTALAANPTPAKSTSWLTKIFGWLSADALLFASDVISVIFSALFGSIIYIEALIIDAVLSPDNFSFTNAQIVTLGWGITRDLANMFLF